MMKIYIKNMVCIRCKMIVQQELTALGLHAERVELGVVTLSNPVNLQLVKNLHGRLKPFGLAVLKDKKSILINKIKKVIVEMVHHRDAGGKLNFSDLLAAELNYNYTYLANLFSEKVGTNIEQYIIAHKIERVKELLMYDELSLKQISYKMHYSSTAHLSNQFKKITGCTPTHFKRQKVQKRMGLASL